MSDDTVLIARSGRRTYSAYHTDAECISLSGALNIDEIPRENVREGAEECPHCAGEVDYHSGNGSERVDALLEMHPDELAADGGHA